MGGGAGERERGVRMTRFLARVIGKMARSYSKMGGPTAKQVWRKKQASRLRMCARHWVIKIT